MTHGTEACHVHDNRQSPWVFRVSRVPYPPTRNTRAPSGAVLGPFQTRLAPYTQTTRLHAVSRPDIHAVSPLYFENALETTRPPASFGSIASEPASDGASTLDRSHLESHLWPLCATKSFSWDSFLVIPPQLLTAAPSPFGLGRLLVFHGPLTCENCSLVPLLSFIGGPLRPT